MTTNRVYSSLPKLIHEYHIMLCVHVHVHTNYTCTHNTDYTNTYHVISIKW